MALNKALAELSVWRKSFSNYSLKDESNSWISDYYPTLVLSSTFSCYTCLRPKGKRFSLIIQCIFSFNINIENFCHLRYKTALPQRIKRIRCIKIESLDRDRVTWINIFKCIVLCLTGNTSGLTGRHLFIVSLKLVDMIMFMVAILESALPLLTFRQNIIR